MAWLGRLDREEDNLRAALRWLAANGEPDAALRLAAALQVWWLTHGSRVEGLAWLERLLAATAAPPATPARLGALDAAGLLAWLMGQADQAWAYPEEALRLARALGDRRAEGRAHYGLGRAALHDRRRDPATGEAHLRRSLALGRELEDAPLVGWSLYFLGTAAVRRGDLATARALREEGCAVWRPTGDRFGYGNALNALARVALAQGDLGAARALWEERLGLAQELGGPVAVAQALEGLAAVAEGRGDYPAARRLLARGLRAKGPFSAPHNTVASLAAAARLAAKHGEHARAARLAGAAEAISRGVDAVPDSGSAADRALAAALRSARTALGQEAYRRAHTEGRALSPEQAVAYALEDAPAAAAAPRPSAGAPHAGLPAAGPPADGPAHGLYHAPPPTAAPALPPGARLTAREREVAALVAEGLSNRALAARLVVTVRTAENHVQRLLDKLGLGSRTRLALWARAHLPLPADDAARPALRGPS